MLKDIQEQIRSDLADVDQLILKSTASEVGLIQQIRAAYIGQHGRKLMRPTIILLSAQCIELESPAVKQLAAIIELVHIATLLHDDVIDNAKIRRSSPSINHAFGNKPSILMGDFIYGCAFNLIAELESTMITSHIAQATRKIIEGEILQYSQRNNPHTSLSDYNFIIDAKTACLFSTGNQCIEALSPKHSPYLATFAWHLGMAYQITDDILDVDTTNHSLNKEHGKDLTEGLVTLPTLITKRHANPDEIATIDRIIKGALPWQDILPIIKRTNALHLCQNIAQAHIKKAKSTLTQLPNNQAQESLFALLDNIPSRRR
jgi:octaprenyl-diphosphate synthase